MDALRRHLLVAPGGQAQRGMARLVAVFVGSGLVFYLGSLWPRAMEQAALSVWWFTPVVVTIILVGAAVLLAGAAVDRTRTIRIGAWIVVLGIPVCHLLWPFAWQGGDFAPLVGYPWMLDFIGLAPMAGVLLLRAPALIVYHVVVTAAVQLIPLPYRPDLLLADTVMWTTNSVVFSGVFVLGTYSLFRSGVRADAEAGRAEELAAETAGATAMALERERLDAIVHDDVLGTLLAVARTGNSGSVAQLARAAIDRLDTAGQKAVDEPIPVSTFVGLLRGAIGSVDSSVQLDVSGPTDGVTASATIAGDLAAATMEAMRNSLLHSGDPDGPRVHLDVVPAGSREPGRDALSGLRIRVTDSGRGFHLRSVPQTRLGVRGSILRRVNALPGGRAEIDSLPGQGTTVRIWWSP